jgi:hypothetical protein
MSINATVTRRADGGWSFAWDPGTPPYAIWLDGHLIATVDEEESYEFIRPNYDDAPPDLEILNTADVSESELYPPFLQIQWRGLLTAAGYIIQQYIAAAWVSIQTIQEKQKGYYIWRSPALDDGSSPLYRVMASDLQGNVGDPIAFTVEVVRNPEHPEVEFSISTSGDVVVSQA